MFFLFRCVCVCVCVCVYVCVFWRGRERGKRGKKGRKRKTSTCRRLSPLPRPLVPSLSPPVLLLDNKRLRTKSKIAGLLESVRSARYGKLRDGIGQLTGPMAVKLTNITASELNAVRPFFLGALTAVAAVAAPPGGGGGGANGGGASAAAASEAAPAAAATAPPPPASQSQPQSQPGGRFRTRNR